MTVTAVVGAQWGDEGKGRIIDYLAQQAEMVIRFQGGDNAGHTVVNDQGTFALHLVPSGIFNPDTSCIVGTGTVVFPDALAEELELLETAGVSLDNLWLSERAQLLMPYHRLLDGLEEAQRADGKKIGTTKRGIGPAYADKAARCGLRLGDLKRPDHLRQRLEAVLSRKNHLLQSYGEAPLALEPLLELVLGWGETHGARIVDTLPMIKQAVQQDQRILLEGQLGVMRDLDWGIYPYVTSSNPVAGGACTGAGLPPRAIDQVFGVVKAYSTAVGAGPFPTELHDETGDQLRKTGNEYGATTGRPRRCGWFDGVAITHGTWLNGFTGIAVTKLDVLDELSELKICVAYELDGQRIEGVPDTPVYEQVTPVYESWPGWNSSTRDVRSWDDLPAEARAYLARISQLAGVPIRFISVGPERDRLIVLDD